MSLCPSLSITVLGFTPFSAGVEQDISTSLRGRKVEFCRGCLVCLRAGECVIKDDAVEIA